MTSASDIVFGRSFILSAKACKEYAFTTLGFQEVYSIIRENNLPSQRVALRNGMSVRGSFLKYYHGMEMRHLLFSVKRGWDA